MITIMTCEFQVNEQDAIYPTYVGVDCDLHIDKNTHPHFYGIDMNCDSDILAGLTQACLSTKQRIRI
jgi:hypothetical protein